MSFTQKGVAHEQAHSSNCMRGFHRSWSRRCRLASAQWAVVDAPAIAQLIQEVQTMQQQLQVTQGAAAAGEAGAAVDDGRPRNGAALERHQPQLPADQLDAACECVAEGRRISGTRLRRAQRDQCQCGPVADTIGGILGGRPGSKSSPRVRW